MLSKPTRSSITELKYYYSIILHTLLKQFDTVRPNNEYHQYNTINGAVHTHPLRGVKPSLMLSNIVLSIHGITYFKRYQQVLVLFMNMFIIILL